MVVVAAVDRSDRARSVVEEAATLAEKFELPLHVLHVMKRSEAIEAEGESVSNNDALSIDELRERATETAQRALEAAHTEAGTTAVGLIGDPATEVVKYAEERNARYVVVSPQRKTRTGKILFGSVAQSILLSATCPVVSRIDGPSN